MKDSNLARTYVASNHTKIRIIENLIVPRNKYMAILGSLNKHSIKERTKSALSDRLRLKKEKEAAPLDEPKSGYVKNEATGRLIKVGSRKYKELYPNTKKAVGRPKKGWDPVVDYVKLTKDLDGVDDKGDVREVVNSIPNRMVKLLFSKGKSFEFLAKHRKELLAKILTDGLSKNNVINILDKQRTRSRLYIICDKIGHELKKRLSLSILKL